MTRARDVANIDGVLTATGDTYYASAAATPARLGIGAAGTYLTSNGTVPSWGSVSAGGMTLISSTTPSGTSTTISSIPQTYKNLLILIEGITTTSNSNFKYSFKDSGSTDLNLIFIATIWYGANKVFANGSTTSAHIDPEYAMQIKSASPNNAYAITINDYASTLYNKSYNLYGKYLASDSNIDVTTANGVIDSNSAIHGFTLTHSGTATAGAIKIYGVS